ncbi:SNF1-related protein kinase regulatory subunit gamma-like PV42a isoform X2 [Prunus yedoensis var. nudiflora]|uniref:SNF1-related protein kinase regulatory subunit gamma-like PV42a isoform X2 n=1 Tax=Prunus yedoensis var. nudiflora TaxID=2094558 RepID=A0A314Z8S8_PRUYE|nr:SNF1-related protein kinase regulatory subunit gamma-like PV42a isoform X2 [Prunus yedoensis var. nudiflora]
MEHSTAKHYSEADQSTQRLRDKKVGDLMVNKRRLVEVPYTASLAHTMNTLVANKVLAVPVAAPPGQWIGAGGSMIMEADKHTGTVRKHYIGLATMLDLLAHIAGTEDQLMDEEVHDGFDLDEKMSVPVSSIIGQCLEGLSLWTLNPNTSILDCMEVFSKGIHRALVPVDSHMDNVSGVELVESASSYRMLTQMDVLRFVKEHGSSGSELDNIMSSTVLDLGAVTERVFAITPRTKVIDAIKCMRIALLNAVAIVRSSDTDNEEDHKQLVNGRGRQAIGTFSATDLRGCHIATLQTWLPMSALDYNRDGSPTTRELVACRADSSLGEVIDKVVSKHVHRLWVVDQQGLLKGLISLTDIIRVLRLAIVSEQNA